MKKKTVFISVLIVLVLICTIFFNQILGQILYWSREGIKFYRPPHVAVVNDENILDYAKFYLHEIYGDEDTYTCKRGDSGVLAYNVT